MSWAGQAGRFAFIGADNGIYTADYNGGSIIKIAQGVDPSQLPAATRSYIAGRIADGRLQYLGAVGGQADKALGTAWGGYAPLGGADRYATSYNVASHLWYGFTAVGVATGVNWPDSLAGGALMGREGGPLVLVDPNYGVNLQEYQLFDANRGSDDWGFVFGGEQALPARVDSRLAAAIDTATGSAHYTGAGSQAQLSTPNLTTM